MTSTTEIDWSRNPEIEQAAYEMGVSRDRVLRTRVEDLQQIVLGVRSRREKKQREKMVRLERAPRAYTRTELLDPREHEEYSALAASTGEKPKRTPRRLLSLPKISVSHLLSQNQGLRQLNEVVHDVIAKADQLEAGVQSHRELQEQYRHSLAPEEIAWMNEQSDTDLEHIGQVREFLADVMHQLGQLIAERTRMLNTMEHGQDARSETGRSLIARLKHKNTKMELLLTAMRARFDCLPTGAARQGVD